MPLRRIRIGHGDRGQSVGGDLREGPGARTTHHQICASIGIAHLLNVRDRNIAQTSPERPQARTDPLLMLLPRLMQNLDIPLSVEPLGHAHDVRVEIAGALAAAQDQDGELTVPQPEALPSPRAVPPNAPVRTGTPVTTVARPNRAATRSCGTEIICAHRARMRFATPGYRFCSWTTSGIFKTAAAAPTGAAA